MNRYKIQHSRIFEFYADCSSIKYLTSLISLPKLPPQPPLFAISSPETITPIESPKPRQLPSPDTHLTIHQALPRPSLRPLHIPTSKRGSYTTTHPNHHPVDPPNHNTTSTQSIPTPRPSFSTLLPSTTFPKPTRHHQCKYKSTKSFN